MKVLTEPRVAIVGHSTFVEHPEYKIPDDGDDATKLGSFAAKGCYDSYGKDGRPNKDNQIAILEHAHGAVMEHYTVSFFIEGITRGLSLELNRHRPLNISQRSTRYTEEEDSAIVLDPYYAELWNRHEMTWLDFHEKTQTGINVEDGDDSTSNLERIAVGDYVTDAHTAILAYQNQVDLLTRLNPEELEGFDLRKWCRGKARGLLPHNLETRGTWTNNLRGWRWFIELRSNRGAEPEIRRLADYILHELHQLAPVYFDDFLCEEIIQGIPEWVPKYHKV